MRRTYRVARTRGFTVAELIIAIAIILIAAALLQPVLVRVSHRAKESKCASNLRQIHVAISVYRDSYGGEGNYGTETEMALPPSLSDLYPSYVTSRWVFRCSLGEPWHTFTRMFPPPPNGDTPWPEYTRTYQADSILVMDQNHDWEAKHIPSPFLKHRATGVYVGGHIRTLIKHGDPGRLLWWNEE